MESAHFENEVRRVARYRWPAAEFAGAEMIGGKERDGVFVTDDCVHLVESTTSREKAKALKDLEKLYELSKEQRKLHSDKVIKCWFITRHEPTADQRACRKEIKGAQEGLFNVVSFHHFHSKLIDTFEYLQDREQHKFGSIYDPATGSPTKDVKYIEVGLTCHRETSPISVSFVANSLLAGQCFVVLGEYGVGKSMTLRAIFKDLAGSFRKGKTTIFPLYINLREHQGQQEPAEILERHGRNIGFPNPSQLVRAWKAGYAILLLDGFDEVSSMGLQGAWRRLRDARNASMAGVRRLITESPPKTGIAIAGRENFFDTPEERRKALGESSEWKEIHLDEFTEEQVHQLIKMYGFDGAIPSWVPARPLLLATLFAKGMTPEISQALAAYEDASAGWDLLLDEVCSREARIEQGITGENMRGILESLSTLARGKDSGVGPLTSDEIIAIFQAECGFAPSDEALTVLQRLPGLGRAPAGDDTARAFVDADFADACRAGDFVNFCRTPFSADISDRLAPTRIAIGELGVGLAARRLGDTFSHGEFIAATKAIDKTLARGATSVDLVNLAKKLGIPIETSIYVSKLFIDDFEVDGPRFDLSRITFDECFFDRLELTADSSSDNSPHFNSCLIQELDGRISRNDLPDSSFDDRCVIEKFTSSAGTTSSVLDLAIPIGARVLITILKKLFVRSLSGRKENALYRGLDAEHQGKVSAVLGLLQSHGLITTSGRSGDPIWLPVRRQRARVLGILNAPSKGSDPLLVAARQL